MKKMREPINGITHLIGAILSLVGMIIMIRSEMNNYNKTSLGMTAVIIFGLSLVFLYTASTVYHSVRAKEKVLMILRKIDHSMIYVLIAGTYTPICLITLTGKLRWTMFISIWSIAGLGIVMKIFWFNVPRWLSTTLYVVMGWLSVLLILPIYNIVSAQGILWLVLGGILYTVGAVIYATKKPKLLSNVFGFHEIFHLFVLLGSFCHFWLVLKYVI